MYYLIFCIIHMRLYYSINRRSNAVGASIIIIIITIIDLMVSCLKPCLYLRLRLLLLLLFCAYFMKNVHSFSDCSFILVGM